MRRHLTVIVLALFAAGSALNLRCLFSCAPPPVSKFAAHCQHSTDSRQQIKASSDCDARATQPPALGASRIQSSTPSVLPVMLTSVNARRPHGHAAAVETFYDPAAGPPHFPPLIPLRI